MNDDELNVMEDVPSMDIVPEQEEEMDPTDAPPEKYPEGEVPEA